MDKQTNTPPDNCESTAAELQLKTVDEQLKTANQQLHASRQRNLQFARPDHSSTRLLTFDLSSPILYELGLEAVVGEWLVEQIQQKHGIAVEFEDDGQFKPLDEDIRVLLMATKIGGFGLFSIRERLGGHLEIESKRGHGTTFTVTAPLKDEKDQNSASDNSEVIS